MITNTPFQQKKFGNVFVLKSLSGDYWSPLEIFKMFDGGNDKFNKFMSKYHKAVNSHGITRHAFRKVIDARYNKKTIQKYAKELTECAKQSLRMQIDTGTILKNDGVDRRGRSKTF